MTRRVRKRCHADNKKSAERRSFYCLEGGYKHQPPKSVAFMYIVVSNRNDTVLARLAVLVVLFPARCLVSIPV